jgi:hypothetical protein
MHWPGEAADGGDLLVQHRHVWKGEQRLRELWWPLPRVRAVPRGRGGRGGFCAACSVGAGERSCAPRHSLIKSTGRAQVGA